MSENAAAPQKSPSTARLGLYLVFAAFLIIVFVFKDKIHVLSFGPGEVKATMGDTKETSNLSPEDAKKSEQALMDRISKLEEAAKVQSVSESPAQTQTPSNQPLAAGNQPMNANPFVPAATIPNLAGLWTGIDGNNYVVTQVGNNVLLKDINRMNMVVAMASGPIYGMRFSLPTYNLAGMAGTLSLEVSNDARQMRGQYMDPAAGTVYMQLDRRTFQ
jgi:hypothetical protein